MRTAAGAGEEEGGILCGSPTPADKYRAHHIDSIYNDSRQLEWVDLEGGQDISWTADAAPLELSTTRAPLHRTLCWP